MKSVGRRSTYFLPSITDRKEVINHLCDNVHLTPIDFNIEFIESFSKKKVKFAPHLLNSSGPEHMDQVDMLYGLFKHLVTISNQNLTRNVDYLNVHDKRGSDEMEWSVGRSNKRFDSRRGLIKLTY